MPILISPTSITTPHLDFLFEDKMNFPSFSANLVYIILIQYLVYSDQSAYAIYRLLLQVIFPCM